MKYFFPLLTLAVLVVACNSAEVQNQNGVNNSAEVQKQYGARLNVGWMRPGDVLLAGRNAVIYGRPNAIQTQDVIFTGTSRTVISAINAYQVGWNQYATAYIIRGGVGYNYVTIRLQTARGYGFNFNVNIWGRN